MWNKELGLLDLTCNIFFILELFVKFIFVGTSPTSGALSLVYVIRSMKSYTNQSIVQIEVVKPGPVVKAPLPSTQQQV